MTKERLQKILDDHELWLSDPTEGQRADLSGADLSGASLRGASLRDADLSGASLSGASLRDADLRGASLRGASLSGADLRGADLRGASLICTHVFTFTLGAHFGFAHFGKQYIDGSYVKIGCEGHSLDYWLENHKEIGEGNDYTNKQVKDYGLMLNLLKEIK